MNTKKYENSIIDYLKNPENEQCLLITGNWGSGKTHFLKEKILPSISKMKINSNELKYLYISLNGLTSTNEIDEKLIAAQLGRFHNNYSKTIYGLFSGSLKKFGIDLDSAIDNLELYTFSDYVFVIDDLERISSSLATSDVLGYVNSTYMVNGVKRIIVVGNEEEIYNKDEVSYSRLKEKVIFKTIVYEPELASLYPAIFDEYKISNDKSVDIIKATVLKSMSRSGTKNIRTYKFVLSNLRTVFSVIDASKYSSSTLISIVEFTTFVAVEVKSGYETLIKEANLKLKNRNLKDKKAGESFIDLPDTTLGKYFQRKNNYFHFFQIVELILSGSFVVSNLEKEINALEARSKEINKSNQLKRIGTLMVDFERFTYEEFKRYVDELIQLIRLDKIPVQMYPKVVDWLYNKDVQEILSIDYETAGKQAIEKFSEIYKGQSFDDDFYSFLNSERFESEEAIDIIKKIFENQPKAIEYIVNKDQIINYIRRKSKINLKRAIQEDTAKFISFLDEDVYSELSRTNNRYLLILVDWIESLPFNLKIEDGIQYDWEKFERFIMDITKGEPIIALNLRKINFLLRQIVEKN